jgi:hypothetical protein
MIIMTMLFTLTIPSIMTMLLVMLMMLMLMMNMLTPHHQRLSTLSLLSLSQQSNRTVNRQLLVLAAGKHWHELRRTKLDLQLPKLSEEKQRRRKRQL